MIWRPIKYQVIHCPYTRSRLSLIRYQEKQSILQFTKNFFISITLFSTDKHGCITITSIQEKWFTWFTNCREMVFMVYYLPFQQASLQASGLEPPGIMTKQTNLQLSTQIMFNHYICMVLSTYQDFNQTSGSPHLNLIILN